MLIVSNYTQWMICDDGDHRDGQCHGLTVCWLVVWNHGILWLSIYWEFHNPNWLIFFRGFWTWFLVIIPVCFDCAWDVCGATQHSWHTFSPWAGSWWYLGGSGIRRPRYIISMIIGLVSKVIAKLPPMSCFFDANSYNWLVMASGSSNFYMSPLATD